MSTNITFTRNVCIYSVLGGKVSILEGHSIGHSKQINVYMYMCPIPRGFLYTAILLYDSKIEECRLLGWGAVWVYYKPTFRRNVLPPSSG
jgi:hypothetical protein